MDELINRTALEHSQKLAQKWHDGTMARLMQGVDRFDLGDPRDKPLLAEGQPEPRLRLPSGGVGGVHRKRKKRPAPTEEDA